MCGKGQGKSSPCVLQRMRQAYKISHLPSPRREAAAPHISSFGKHINIQETAWNNQGYNSWMWQLEGREQKEPHRSNEAIGERSSEPGVTSLG